MFDNAPFTTRPFVLLAIFLLSLVYSCNNVTDTSNLAVVEGSVYTYSEGQLVPVENALISALEVYRQTETDLNGKYSFSLDISAEQQITLQASKAGYISGEVRALAKTGEVFRAPDITLTLINSDTTGGLPVSTSGDAAHIQVLENPPAQIYIYSSGLQESATLRFVVTDAEGNAVDNQHSETVFFRILNGPGGGEYLFPDSMTSKNGLVSTTLNSGIKAGPVQIEAYFVRSGATYRTIPPRLAIYGGLPDQDHFSLAAEQRNIAGQVNFGIVDNITAFVGDKFSNPVAPGTIVYFTTQYGIIQGAAVTDELGRAVVQYLTAAPLPTNPANNSFTEIRAYTFSDTLGEKKVETSLNLLLSAATAGIEITPQSFNYTNLNNGIAFDYKVRDIYGNPLVADTRIKVSSTAGTLYGDKDLTLLDNTLPGNGSTEFSFSWAPGDSLKDTQVYINIQVTSPQSGNGSRSLRLVGTKVDSLP